MVFGLCQFPLVSLSCCRALLWPDGWPILYYLLRCFVNTSVFRTALVPLVGWTCRKARSLYWRFCDNPENNNNNTPLAHPLVLSWTDLMSRGGHRPTLLYHQQSKMKKLYYIKNFKIMPVLSKTSVDSNVWPNLFCSQYDRILNLNFPTTCDCWQRWSEFILNLN